MKEKLKLFFEDLKERELYFPLGVVVLILAVYNLAVNKQILHSQLADLAEKNREKAKQVERYWPLKENEEENLKKITRLRDALRRKFEFTERVYVKNQNQFLRRVKLDVVKQVREKSKLKDNFSIVVRAGGSRQKLQDSYRYRALITMTSTFEDVINLFKEMQRKDSMLLEIREFKINWHKQFPDKTVMLKTRFKVYAYQRRKEVKIEGLKNDGENENGPRAGGSRPDVREVQ